MRDYAEPIAELRLAAERKTITQKTRDACRDAADAIEELVAAVPKWISVEDPPKDKGEYIVAYYPCEWDNVYQYTIKVGIDTFRGKTTWAKKKYQRVIYWMEKPNPPKEVTGDA